MMTIKDSGWAGKAKVAIALSAVVLFALVTVQCNSALEDQEVSVADFSQAASQHDNFSLPVLSETGNFISNVDLSNSLTLQISKNIVTVDGRAYEVNEIAAVLSDAHLTASSVIIMEIDKSQRMGLVRDVQDILRTENKRKVVYRARDQNNSTIELPTLLPPHANNNYGIHLPEITDEYAIAHDIDVMKVKVNENLGVAYQNKVVDLVQKNMAAGFSNYVVSVKFESDDSYDDYISSLFYVYRGFDQIYDERAQKMFGKSFYDLDKREPQGKEMYDAVRKGIPRAISIAERI